MRILLTTDTIGGVWTFSRELATELLRRGHAVALVSFGRLPSSSQAAWCMEVGATYPKTFSYVSSSTPLEWMSNNELAYEAGLPLLLKVANTFHPDVIHSNQFCFGALPIRTSKVVTAHSDVLSWAAACRPYGLAASPWLDRYCALVNKGLAGAAAVTAPTSWMLDAVGEHFALSVSTRVIFNGRGSVVVSDLSRRMKAVSAGRLWDEGKNLLLLEGINAPMPIVIAGEARYESASALPNRDLKMAGLLSEVELFALFSESSIYIAPSCYEPFGLAPLEAALCGCALVMNDLPSFREIWGDHALYFCGKQELRDVLNRLYNSPAELLQARTTANHRARQLTAAWMADEYLSVYCDVVGKNKVDDQEYTAHAS